MLASAITRLQVHLANAVEAEGQPHPMLRGLARHLYQHLLVPSGRGGGHGGAWAATAAFTSAE